MLSSSKSVFGEHLIAVGVLIEDVAREAGISAPHSLGWAVTTVSSKRVHGCIDCRRQHVFLVNGPHLLIDSLDSHFFPGPDTSLHQTLLPVCLGSDRPNFGAMPFTETCQALLEPCFQV